MEVLYDFGKAIRGIAIDGENNILVANWDNYSIDKISLNNGRVSITQSANISPSPRALAINSKNEIYIGMGNGEIMKMTKEGIISKIAGSGTFGFADGIGKNAKIGNIYGICFDESDIAYFCDYDNINSKHSIRKLTPDGKVTTICGGEKGNSNGKGEQAKFNLPLGIVYNYSTKLFYITDSWNKSIRTMTVDGNVSTLCTHSDNLQAIAIDGEGKLYVSTVKDIKSGKGELITVDTEGKINQMNISTKDCFGIAFNSKGDLFFTSDNKLCVIRNCTKYPPHPILAPITNVNTKGELEVQSSDIVTQLKSENQELRKQLEAEKQKYLNGLKELEAENNILKIKLQESEQKETKEEGNEGNKVLQWLSSIDLSNLFPILQNLGVKNLEFLKHIEESDLEGTNIKALEKRILFQAIKKLKEDSSIKVLQNNVNL